MGANSPVPTPIPRNASKPAPAPRTLATRAPTPTPSLGLGPVLLSGAVASRLFGWTPAAAVQGQVAVEAERIVAPSETAVSVTLLRFSQTLLQLSLHAGYQDPGGSGWSHGDAVLPAEQGRLVAAFNGGFKLSTGAGGYLADGRTAVALRTGMASIVSYNDGRTDIGRWGSEVPASGRPVLSVRQNLQPLIDRGLLTSAVGTCAQPCWGETLGGGSAVARSGLGVDAGGRLIWAGGERLTVRALAEALLSAGAVRALELDINPEWVAGYLYRHPTPSTAAAVQQIPTQPGVPGQFLAPYRRDFFTLTVR